MLIATTILVFLSSARADAEVRDEVVVEAERTDSGTAWDTASSVSIIEVDNRTTAGASVASLIGQAPGVQLQQFGDADSFSGVSIRGSTLRQVAVYLDSIPLNPDGGQVVNLSEWPLRALERIEVYRGNAPAALGGAAMGGAINLVPATQPVPLTGGGSAHSTQRYAADAYAQGTVAWFGQPQTVTLFNDVVIARGLFTYFADNGTPFNRTDDRRLMRTHNASSSAAGLFRWSTKIGRTKIKILDSWIKKGSELPGHINNPSQHARIDLGRNLLGVSALYQGDAHRMDAVGWISHRSEQYDDRSNELGLDAQWGTQTNRNMGLRVHDVRAFTRWFALGVTGGVQTDQPKHADLLTDRQAIQPTRWTQMGTMEAPLSLGPFGITPVGHGTWVSYPGQERSDLQRVDPRVGIRWRPAQQLSLRANAGRYVRTPDTTELYGDRGSMIGNANLRPERGWQWDVGGRTKWKASESTFFAVDIGHFWNASVDRITWVQNGQKTLRPMNFGRTWVQGLEGSLNAVVATDFAVQSSLTWTQSRNLSPAAAVANNQLPGVPTWSSATGSTWTHPSERWHLRHLYRYTDGNFWDATNWFRAAPRQFHDFFAQWRTSADGLQIELGVENLLNSIVDVVDQNPLQTNQSFKAVQPIMDFSGHPLPGRTWMIGVRWIGGAS